MSLVVHVRGEAVATLEALGDFRSSMRYLSGAPADKLVSLTMPVRDEQYAWDDVLHPVFQMNLPEGYLLQVLQERFGPHISGNPMALLAVVGRNTIGRMQVAPEGADLRTPAKHFDVAMLLRGDNSEEAFDALVREYAESGVSGVVPKFLDNERHPKLTLASGRHIVKGSTRRIPFAALNEHLCMSVARQVLPAATTTVSDDGQALIVERFDVDEEGNRQWALEDFCALLGMRPAQKYDTTWERIARAVRHHVPIAVRGQAFEQLATLLLLTFALRNADCHSKNIALRYTHRADVHLAPAYDLVTTVAYEDYQLNPPGLAFAGRKTWDPGKTLPRFIETTFGVPMRRQVELVDLITAAVVSTMPALLVATHDHTGFRATGSAMLAWWRTGIDDLRAARTYDLPPVTWDANVREAPLPTVPSRRKTGIGRSELMGKR